MPVQRRGIGHDDLLASPIFENSTAAKANADLLATPTNPARSISMSSTDDGGVSTDGSTLI